MKILVVWKDDASGFVQELRNAYGKEESKALTIEVAYKEQSLVNLFKPVSGKNEKTRTEPFVPKRIFILVELDWIAQDWYGYTVFHKFILTYNEIFTSIKNTAQITFVSLKSKSQIMAELGTNGGAKYLIASHYQHIEFPGSVEVLKKLPYNSNFHYEFLRQITLQESIFIAKIEHDIDNLKPGVEPIFWENIKRDIKCLRSILSEKLINTIDLYDISEAIKNKEQIKSSVREEYYQSLPPEKQKGLRKSEYKVIIIEDDLAQLKFLTEVLSKYFVTVHGLFITRKLSLPYILEELKHFDIAFIDLLFEDGEGFLHFSGFDLVHQIKFNKDFDHIAFRLSSNMPRHMIGSIIDISVNHIIPKKLEDQTKMELIGLEINPLIEEIREKQRSKLYDYGPIYGPFGKDGLKKTFFNEEKIDPNSFFEKYWGKAFYYAGLFIKDELFETTPGWKKELYSPKSKDEMKLNEFMDKHLPIILAHRLMVFYFSLNEINSRKKPLFLELNHFSNKLLPLVNINIIKRQKAYFNTMLGISCFTSSADENDPYVEIKFINLFPKEIDWLNINVNKTKIKISIKENNQLFYKWLYQINKDQNFPNGIWPTKIDDWTYFDFDNFVETLIDSGGQYDDLIESLYIAYNIYKPNEDSIPSSTIESLDKLCNY